MGYHEERQTMNYAKKKENFLPIEEGQRRVFRDGQFQGWEYVGVDGRKGIEIFLCFVERDRVGEYLYTLSSVGMAKSLVAGIQKWIDEMEGKDAIKESWMNDVNRISSNRSWTELENHFLKHVGEMERLDKNEKERALDKAASLLDLCAFAIRKTGLDVNFDQMDYKRMVERIDAHEKFLAEEAERMKKLEEERKKAAAKKPAYDDDTD